MSRSVQISFLGRVRGGSQNYRKARYRFPCGEEAIDRFFGLALQRVHPSDRLVFLGTAGSMWPVLLEHVDAGEDEEELRAELMAAEEGEAVSQELLDRVEALVSRGLGVECALRLIPYGRDELEQRAILHRLAESVHHGERVTMDLTHGLRHLPMIAFVSALYLQHMEEVEVSRLYYGALDMTESDPDHELGETPVLRLDGLLEIAGWLQDLRLFDQRGDFGVFAERLEGAGLAPEAVSDLRAGAFFERINDAGRARRPLANLDSALRATNLEGPAALFAEPLRRRVSWAHGSSLQERQARLAWSHLRHGDYLRAAIFGYEAFITMQVRSGDPMSYVVRDEARQEFQREHRKTDEGAAFQSLADLRNALAHSTRAKTGTAQSAMSDETRLRERLAELFRTLGLPTAPEEQ